MANDDTERMDVVQPWGVRPFARRRFESSAATGWHDRAGDLLDAETKTETAISQEFFSVAPKRPASSSPRWPGSSYSMRSMLPKSLTDPTIDANGTHHVR